MDTKKTISVMLLMLITAGMVFAAGKPDSTRTSSSRGKITVETNMVGAISSSIQEVNAAFTKETGIQVEYIAPGNDYEAIMKAKMSTGDMPDVFSTHGWAVARYGTFLRSLNDQPWASKVVPSIRPMITDSKNNLLVLPINVDMAGIVYNRKILKNVGIEVDSIKTWSDFENACTKIRDAGFIPIFLGAKDTWTIGQFFDWAAPSFFITNETHNERKAFLDGSFDWNKWTALLAMFDKWNKAGYLNKDALTADYATCGAQLGQGRAAFAFFGNYIIGEAMKTNPSVDLGMMPIPALSTADTPTCIGGEHFTFGVWKDSKNMAEALAYLEYLSREEVLSKLAASTQLPAGLRGVASNTGPVTQDYLKYASIRTFPYFDRVYLPSGMWDDLCTTGIAILKGEPLPAQITLLKSSYETKRSQMQ